MGQERDKVIRAGYGFMGGVVDEQEEKNNSASK
jgi:hypothetical protein